MRKQSSILQHKFFDEWHPSKNGDLKPSDVSSGSNKRVWWKCPRGIDHEWQAMVIKRARGNGCPYCSGHKVAKSTSLGSLRPEIAKEWHPTKNGMLTPYDVSIGSGKKIWWICSVDSTHEWDAFINNRKKGSSCPICKNKKTIRSNSLGNLNKALAAEWHTSKNGLLTPYNVTPGSNKKVWWQCKKNKTHEWRTAVNFRSKGTGCPHCGFSTSRPELRLYAELKTIFSSTQHRAIVSGHEVDIYIPEIGVGIEYDGEFWHRGKRQNDKQKNEALKEHVFLIRVRERGLSKINDIDIQLTEIEVSIDIVKSILDLTIRRKCIANPATLTKVNNYLKCNAWIAADEYKKLLAEKSQVPFESSISHLFPELTKQWHPKKNHPLLPKNFTAGSQHRVWWKCNKGNDHEWEASIYERTSGNGCSICSNKKIVTSNSLATLAPELAAEWNYEKNKGVTPNDVGLGSNKKFWWKCSNGEDHEWRTQINRRQGCPICSNRKAVLSNCLSTCNSELAAQWHPTKNGMLTPYEITPGSNKVVWWKCPKGVDHEWKAQVLTRNNGYGCPMCSNQKIIDSNSLASIDPRIAKQWHPSKNGKLTPREVAPNSGKKYWWLGKCGHEWQATANNRRTGKDCPKCKHKKALKTRRKNQENKDQLVLGDILV